MKIKTPFLKCWVSSSHLCFLDILALRIREIQQLHRFLVPASLLAVGKNPGEIARERVHGEHNPSAHDQSGQPRDGPGPECEDAFVLEDLRSTDKAVLVIPTGLERLHSVPVISQVPAHWPRALQILPRLHCVQGLCHVSDECAVSTLAVRPFESPRTYTVMRPATPPMAKVLKVPSFSPGAT